MSRPTLTRREGDHLEDAALVRYLDGELDTSDHARTDAHLAGCDPCQAALAELRAASRRVSAWLPLADEPPAPTPRVLPFPVPRRIPAIVRAAAVLALLAGLSLAIGPVRARIADWIGFGEATDSRAPIEERIEPRRADDGGVRISFVPTGDRFTLSFDTSATPGTVTIEPVEGPRVTGEVIGGEAELTTLPDGIVVRNASGPDVAYRIEVPRETARLEIRARGRTVWSGAPRATVLELDAGGR